MRTKIKSKILVAANDAGGAEVLAAYIKAHKKNHQFLPYVAGPAGKIFRREKIKAAKAPASAVGIRKILLRQKNINLVLTGTGWMTQIERLFIIEAKKQNLKTAAFLEHWVNYRERFDYPKRSWRSNLPHEIWVGDVPALKIAKKLFKGITLRLIPNPYFRAFTRRYQKMPKRSKVRSRGILFIGEPYSYTQETLDKLLSHLVKRNFSRPVLLRSHPAEDPKNYQRLIKKYAQRLKMRMSKSKNILHDFQASSVVVGMESAALVLAVMCGKRTISFIPDSKINCPLPFPQIIKIKKAEGLKVIDHLAF